MDPATLIEVLDQQGKAALDEVINSNQHQSAAVRQRGAR